jgi:hypothetical protein
MFRVVMLAVLASQVQGSSTGAPSADAYYRLGLTAERNNDLNAASAAY